MIYANRFLLLPIYRCLVFGTDGLWNVMSANSAVEIVRYAEQMNDQNTCSGENRDWTNPSKCLVDKALEQWSITRTRADNTSVVIIMIDPPGPPKREVLKSNTQQFIVENDHEVDAENDIQAPTVMPALDKRNFTMFDHSTKETVDLNTPMPSEGVSIMTSYELPAAEQPLYATTTEEEGSEDDTDIPVDYTYASSSSNTDISYLTSFAETYHQHAMAAATIEASTIDAAYLYHQHPHPISEHQQGILHHETIDEPSDEPYSLTRLETRTEHYQSTYDESTSTSLTFTEMQQQQELIQQQQMYGDQHQYDSISSSFLSQSCGLMQNPLDDSVQAALLIACEESVAQEETVAVVENVRVDETINEEPIAEFLELYPDPDEIFHYGENEFDETIPSTPVKEEDEDCLPCNDDEAFVQSKQIPDTPKFLRSAEQDEKTPLADGIITDTHDETIQIHEISSSSKENENNACVTCSPPQLRSSKANMQRMTRSKQQKSLQRPTNALTVSRNNRSSRKQRSAVIKVLASTSKTIQNENLATMNVTRVSSRRICQRSSPVNVEPSGFGQDDLSKRTLRSRNLMSIRQTTDESTSTVDVSTTSTTSAVPHAVVTTTIGNPRTSSIVSGRYRSAKQRGVVSTSILMASRQLRGVRDKPIDLVVAHKPKSMAKGILSGIRKVTTSCAKAPAVTTLSKSVLTRNRLHKPLGR